MRRLTAFVMSMCALTVILIVGRASGQANLLTNPSFETIDPEAGFPEGWEPVYWSNPHGTIEASGEARTGEHSVRLAGVPREQIRDAAKRNNHLVSQDLGTAVTGLCKLVLKGCFKTEGDGSAYCSMMTHDQQGNRLQYDSSRRYENQGDWGVMVWQFTTHEDTASLRIYLRNEGEGSVWFDDVTLTGTDDVLENDHLRVMVEPLIGGRVRSFAVKPAGEEKTVWNGVRPGGMAADIVPADSYPGLLRDAPYEVEVLEPNRRILLRHQPADPDLSGLVFEKELSLAPDTMSLDVRLRVRNEADGPRTAHVRAQHCVPPTRGVFTWRTADHLRVYRPEPHILKGSVFVEDLAEGWLAYVDPEAECGLVLCFDRAVAEKAHVYLSLDLYALEWYYRPQQIGPGQQWETAYTVTPLGRGEPVVSVGPDLAIGLEPVKLETGLAYSLGLFPLQGATTARVSLSGGEDLEVTETVSAAPSQPGSLALPWQGRKVSTISIGARTDAGQSEVTLAQASINDEPLYDLPAPPQATGAFQAATSYFPYGEYLRGHVGAEAGSWEDGVARNLRAYRRNYLNTLIVGEGHMLGEFKREGSSTLCDLVRKLCMRVIPKAEMMRQFERAEDGQIKREVFPGDLTREQVIERVIAGGFDLDLRRSFAETYGDVILAYDLSDEPGPEYIPHYMKLQNVFQQVDPEHPVITILNLNRTAYLPYMPIYYGDEYPIRNDRRGGRNPWAVTPVVRFCATHTNAPVWVMLQAFGGREDYTWQLPNEAEMRLTIYSVIQNGGKGITFHGSFSPPCWRYNHHYFYTTCDSWGVATPAWRAMREAGRYLTAIGPSLLETQVGEAKPFAIECEQISVGEGLYEGPAVTVGVLKERVRDGRFLVVVNQDTEKPQQATLVPNPDAVGEADVLFDLYGIASVGPASEAKPTIELAPGAGRILYCGPAEAGEAVCKAVHAGHYENKRALYEIDAELAAANGVQMRAAVQAAERATGAAATGDHTTAHQAIVQAQQALGEAIAAQATLSTALQGLEEALEPLSELAQVYRGNFDVLVPPDAREGDSRYRPWSNELDPEMQQYLDETAECFCDRLKLEDRVYAGEAEAVVGDIERLVESARNLRTEAIQYLRSRAQ